MKETKIEKLILDLSNRWECTPQEAVDRLNSMNESEINKLINSMTKKFKNGGFIDCLRDGGSVEKCKCGCDKIAKAQDGKKVLPRFGKIVEQGWSAPRYTFLHNVNPITVKNAPLNTVTPSNIDDGSYEGMWYAEEQVANPWDEWTNKINKTAGLPAFPRLYKSPDFRYMVNHPTEAGVVSIREDAPVDHKKATKELAEKQATIRTQKKACGGPLPKKSKFKK